MAEGASRDFHNFSTVDLIVRILAFGLIAESHQAYHPFGQLLTCFSVIDSFLHVGKKLR